MFRCYSRAYCCRCELNPRASFSPLAERLPERTSPELTYLETKFAALVSYGLSLKLLEEVLPIGQRLSGTPCRTGCVKRPNAWKPNEVKRKTFLKIVPRHRACCPNRLSRKCPRR